jgi:hypothetical protein
VLGSWRLSDHLRYGICRKLKTTSLGQRVERHLLVKRVRMQSFLIFHYVDRYLEGLRELTGWVRAGLIGYREDILDGIEQAPGSIAGLYRGEPREAIDSYASEEPWEWCIRVLSMQLFESLRAHQG